MSTLIGEERLWQKFFDILEGYRHNARAYVYKIDRNNKPIRPFWFRAAARPQLVDRIQASGGGHVRIIIRDGRKILFSGRLAFSGLRYNR